MQNTSAVTVTGVGEVEGRRSDRPSVLPILNRGVRGVRSSADMLIVLEVVDAEPYKTFRQAC